MVKVSRLYYIPFLTLLEIVAARTIPRATWPNGPFTTSGQVIQDASGLTVTYVGVNWPAHGEAMLPEGLQYASVESIVSKIKSLGMNSIRLTFAVEMVDQIMDNGRKDVSMQRAFADALGHDNGAAIHDKVVGHNPSLVNATRLQVFDAVATECARQEIYVHLDNHVSKAGWCCTLFDGNAWFGDMYFSVANWTRALTFMANHGRQHWPNIMSFALRNELRPPLDDMSLFWHKYNWANWYANTKLGAAAVSAGNPDLLIFLSGVDGDTTVRPVAQGTALTPGKEIFSVDDFPPAAADKLVLELHNYANILHPLGEHDCAALRRELRESGFTAPTQRAFPLVLTEFGFHQGEWDAAFAVCLNKLIPSLQAGWMVWAIGGSYYVRSGVLDFDEPWGLLSHNWSDWRSPEHIEGGLKPLVSATLRAGAASDHFSAGHVFAQEPGARVRGVVFSYFLYLVVVWCSMLIYVFRARGRRQGFRFAVASLVVAGIVTVATFGGIKPLKQHVLTVMLSADHD